MTFKRGDEVICIKNYNSLITRKMTGTIVNIDNKSIGVSWNGLTSGNNCNGSCPYGTGYWVTTQNIQLAKITNWKEKIQR